MKQVIVYEYISKINLLHFVKIPIQLFIICYETRWLKQAFGQLEKYAEMMRVDLPIPDTCVKSEFFFFRILESSEKKSPPISQDSSIFGHKTYFKKMTKTTKL